ncbi:DUF2075 domain-containing protein [Corynebacteriaceae bacterium 7-707]
MPLLRTTGSDILTAFAGPTALVDEMKRNAWFDGLGGVSPAEERSWAESIPALASVLRHAGLGAVPVLLEHQLPLTSKRVDAIIAGTHPSTGEPSYVVVELKQWSRATLYEDSPELVEVPGLPGPPRSHPVLQVDDYRSYLTGFATVLADRPGRVHGAAFLHNASSRRDIGGLVDGLASLRPGAAPESATRLFTGADIGAFSDFLTSRIAPSDDPRPADDLMNTTFAPSRQLLTHAAAEIREREEFVLLDRQHDAVRLVLHQVNAAHRADNKRVIVVSGGPGSGKSVVAMSLLGELWRDGRRVLHATGSNAFTQTLRKVAGHRSRETQQLFKYFNSFQDAEKHMLDVLVADESHRIRETSTNRYTPAHLRARHRPQLDELIDVARVPVFLLDEEQVVRPGELGSLHEISRFAEEKGLEVMHIELGEQFRCGGSLAYTNWVEDLLQLTDRARTSAGDDGADGGDGADPDLLRTDVDVAHVHDVIHSTDDRDTPPVLPPDPHVSVTVADSPQAMESFLRAKLADGFTARMSAGFCWRWSKPKKGEHELVDDVQLGDWSRPWNNPEERRVGGAPPRFRWATADGGFDQVGCIYTAQGFEYDWSGVIIGPDLVWRDGSFVTVRAENADPGLAKKDLTDEEFDVLVRHVYKVLLTRGMQGTVIYSPDRPTRDALKRLVERQDGEVD